LKTIRKIIKDEFTISPYKLEGVVVVVERIYAEQKSLAIVFHGGCENIEYTSLPAQLEVGHNTIIHQFYVMNFILRRCLYLSESDSVRLMLQHDESPMRQ